MAPLKGDSGGGQTLAPLPSSRLSPSRRYQRRLTVTALPLRKVAAGISSLCSLTEDPGSPGGRWCGGAGFQQVACAVLVHLLGCGGGKVVLVHLLTYNIIFKTPWILSALPDQVYILLIVLPKFLFHRIESL
jgi:hypothetical protein